MTEKSDRRGRAAHRQGDPQRSRIDPKARARRTGIIVILAACLIGTGIVAVAADGQQSPRFSSHNLVVNGDFGTGLAGWQVKAPGRMSLVAPGYGGGSAVRLQTSKTSTIALNDQVNTVASNPAGGVYRVSAWVRTLTPNVTMQLRVREVQDAKLVGQGASSAWLRDTAWHPVTFDYTTQAVGSSLDLNVVVWLLKANQALDVSAVSMLALAGQPTPDPPPSGTPTESPTSSQTPTASPTTTSPSPTTTSPSPTTSTPPPTTTSTGGGGGGTCSLNAKLVPSCGALWGMYTTKGSDADWVAPYTNLESKTGRTFDIVKRYHDWSNSGANGQFPDASERALGAGGARILYFAWVSNLYSGGGHVMWKDIAAGKYDASVIIPEAQRLKDWNLPVFVSFDHEMDGATRTTFGSDADFVAAFRHIHDVVTAQGADKVVWVYNPTGYLGNASRIAAMYPGSAYVDWIGYDPYNFYLCHGSPWKTPDSTLNSFYDWAMNQGWGDKPFMLSEYGSSYDPSDAAKMGAWYAGLVPAMQKLPNLKAAIIFNSGNGQKYCDYRITTNTESLAGYRESGLNSYVDVRN